MPPGGDEGSRGYMVISPRIPGAVHLLAEADEHRTAVTADAVGIGPQVVVVVSGRDLRDRGVGGIYLHEQYRAVVADGVGEGPVEGLSPAAEVPDQVRRHACRLSEVIEWLVARRRPFLEDPQVRGSHRRKRGMHGQRLPRR